MAASLLRILEEYKTVGIWVLSLSLLHYMHQQGMLNQLSESTKIFKTIYCLLLDSLGYSREEIQSSKQIKEEIIERKSTNIQLFNFLLNISDEKAKRKAAKRVSKLWRLKKVQKSLNEFKSGSVESRDRLLTINEDEKEE